MNCHVCERPISKYVDLNDGYRGWECENCDLIITDVQYDEAVLNKVNQNIYSLEDRISLYYGRMKEFNRRYSLIWSLIQKVAGKNKINRVLEVGGNIGYFSGYLKKRGIAIDGVETNPQLRQYQENVYGIKAVAKISDLDADSFYDAVVLMDVLEHIPDPVSTLSKIADHVKRDGIIFLQFPNKNSLMAKMAGKKWQWWAAPDHLYHFSEYAIQRVADRVGLKVQYLGKVSPVLDDLANVPTLGKFAIPLFWLNRLIPLNLFVGHRYGSLLQVVLTK